MTLWHTTLILEIMNGSQIEFSFFKKPFKYRLACKPGDLF